MFTKLLPAYYSLVDINLPQHKHFMFTVKPRAYAGHTQEVCRVYTVLQLYIYSCLVTVNVAATMKNTMLERFHDGMYDIDARNTWSCCSNGDPDADGCKEATSYGPSETNTNGIRSFSLRPSTMYIAIHVVGEPSEYTCVLFERV